ncbi:D-inositol 3-phosphate glycosyltransferase [Pelagimonas phthalicica]|uniref:D-inositol 3-phosphate glycosyltransferase n=1 Tax=Pelagimonas phthalicica TaxID=1037362 RepID=A0A238JBH6_9RHOB|nr:glycosyltransferase [Pelagimonas phthalicica]TDS94267.1 glycosyl transferase family 1 [Pelagimonas phthalicica]SMX27206.1 D-inositol 3-phosphate glycosyltransferase [Pelagimonas phthalicica]
MLDDKDRDPTSLFRRALRRALPPAIDADVKDLFDGDYYLRVNQDVREANINPLRHFERFGRQEKRRPNEWFSERYVFHGLDHSSHYGVPPLDAYLASKLQHKPRLVFVSHDASRTGAPAIILRLLEMFSKSGAFECFSILDDGGERLEEFQELSHTYVMSRNRHDKGFSDDEAFAEIARLFDRQGVFQNNQPVLALVNSAESLRIAQGLARQGVPMISLIHEIAAYYGREKFTEFGACSEKVVFPSEFVKKAAAKFSDMDMSKAWVRGQGLLTDGFGSMDRMRCRRTLCENLGLEEDAFIVLNVGTMDVRKGGDLFVDTAKLCLDALPADRPVYFLWYGKPDPSFSYPQEAVRAHGIEDRVRFLPSTPEIEQVFLGGDLFLLTARADPFPCVIHEAMICGLPVVAFREGGGAPELIGDDCGQIVDIYDLAAMAQAVLSYVDDLDLVNAHSGQAVKKIKDAWSYFDYQKDLYDLIKDVAPSPPSGWPELNPPEVPEHLVIMNATQHDLVVFESCEGLDPETPLDIALIDGRFSEEAEEVAERLRQLGHRVRHHQPKANDVASRAALVAKLLVNPRPQKLTLLNTLRFASTAQLRLLAYPIHAVETGPHVDVDLMYLALPYLSALDLTDIKAVENLVALNPNAERLVSLMPSFQKSDLNLPGVGKP